MSPVIPVLVKDAQRQPLPVQTKDVQTQTQAPKESLADPIPAIRPAVKIDLPAQGKKEASAGATSEAPSSATGNNGAMERGTSSDLLLARRSRAAADGDGDKVEAKHEAEAQAVAEAAIRQLEIN